MNRTERFLVWCVPLGWLVMEAACRVMGWRGAPHISFSPIVNNPLFVVTAFVVAVAMARRSEVLPLFALAVPFEAVRWALLLRRGLDAEDILSATGIGFWYASLLISGWQIWRAKGDVRGREVDRAAIKFVFPGGVPLSLLGLELTAQYVHWTFDNFYYAFDGLLPIPAAVDLASFCLHHHWALLTFFVIYESVLIVPVFVVAFARRPDGQFSGYLVSRWILATGLGYFLYFFVPGAGPDVAFYTANVPSLPDPDAIKLVVRDYFGEQPLNAMPSLHAVWALLLIAVTWRMPPIVLRLTAIYVAAVLVSTLGLREHYLIDLIVAVPFSVAVHGAVSFADRSTRRHGDAMAMIGGAALALFLLLVVRYGIGFLRVSGPVAFLLVVAVLAASAWLFLVKERAQSKELGPLSRL